MHDDFILFSGTANPHLAARMAQLLERPLGACTVERFPDGEVNVHLDEPVRGRDVYLLQSVCPPVDEHLMELLCLADACRRASVANLTAVVPYFGYARSDKRNGRRAPVTASMVALMMQAVGIRHVLTVDLHAQQVEGFFHIPVDCVTAVPVLCHALRNQLAHDTVVVSPDEGRVKMASEYARLLGLPVAVLHKHRESGTQSKVTHVVGDVRDRPCLIIDDIISTGGTIAEAVAVLLKAGARPEISVAATHGLFVGDARARLNHPAIRTILVTDTIPFIQQDWPEVRVLPLAALLAAAIGRFRAGESIGDLFTHVIHDGRGDEAFGAGVHQ